MFIGIEKKKWDTLINICVLIKSTSVHKKDGKSRCFFSYGFTSLSKRNNYYVRHCFKRSLIAPRN